MTSSLPNELKSPVKWSNKKTTELNDWVKVLRPTRHKIRYIGDVLPSQYIGVALTLKKLNVTQQKRTTREQNRLS